MTTSGESESDDSEMGRLQGMFEGKTKTFDNSHVITAKKI